MPGFSQLLRDKGIAEDVASQQRRQQPEEEWSYLGNDDFEEEYIVHNSLLRTEKSGICFRRSPKKGSSKTDELVKFGSTVRGVRYGPDYLKVGEYFLPMKINGLSVLYPKQAAQEAEDVEGPHATGVQSEVQLPPDEALGSLRPQHQQGPGALYEVVAQQAAVRTEPSANASVLGPALQRGTLVELFNWDETRRWRECRTASLFGLGWMLLDEPEAGPVLRPKWLPFQVQPHEPMCLAVHENRMRHLRRFIKEGLDVNVRDVAGRTPLMLAAELGHRDCCVMLLEARADASVTSPQGKLAMDLCDSSPTCALLAALLGEPFDMHDCEAAMEALQPRASAGASRLIAQWAELHDRVVEEQGARASVQGAAQVGDRGGGSAQPECGAPVAGCVPAPRGQLYEVRFQSRLGTVPVRREPSVIAKVVGTKATGDVVEVLEVDETGTWGRVEAGKPRGGMGWVMLRHAEMGDLLVPCGADRSGAAGG